MEQLNKVELRGIVGTCHTQEYEDTIHASFAVATNYAYRDKDGTPIVETTWHSVAASEQKDNPVFDLAHLKMGDKVHILGRIQAHRYVTYDGSERTTYRILAQQISKVEDK